VRGFAFFCVFVVAVSVIKLFGCLIGNWDICHFSLFLFGQRLYQILLLLQLPRQKLLIISWRRSLAISRGNHALILGPSLSGGYFSFPLISVLSLNYIQSFLVLVQRQLLELLAHEFWFE